MFNMPKAPKSIIEKLFPVLLGGAIIMSFVIGILWEKVSGLEKGGTTKTTDTTGTQQQAAQQAAQQPTQAPVSLDQIKKLFGQDLVKFGDDKRKVLFVEIEDPSCPYCHVAAGKDPELNAQIGDRFKLVADGGTYVAPVPEMKKLVDQGKASLVYIYTPGHGNGEMGMKALYCAFEKGKFWDVHDLLYTNDGYNLMNNTIKNDKTKSQDLADFLKSAINPNDLKSCLDSGKYDQRLASDTAVAASLGVQGTPGFFVNTKSFAGAYSWKEIEPLVTTALK
jgi:protein-disulfide isomerase